MLVAPFIHIRIMHLGKGNNKIRQFLEGSEMGRDAWRLARGGPSGVEAAGE